MAERVVSRPAGRADRRTPGVAARTSAQALVEFALVFPVFLLVFLGFLQLGVWTYDTQIVVRASSRATIAANARIRTDSVVWANDPRLINERTKLNVANFVGGCSGRIELNRMPGARGWDWGGACSGVSPDGALAAGQAAGVRELKGLLGPHGAPSVQLCYLAADFAEEDCGVEDDLAPAFVRATVSVPAKILIPGPWPSVITLRGATTEVVDRFLPSCSAPQNKGEWKADDPQGGPSCGQVY